jgi:hypothetical protein
VPVALFSAVVGLAGACGLGGTEASSDQLAAGAAKRQQTTIAAEHAEPVPVTTESAVQTLVTNPNVETSTPGIPVVPTLSDLSAVIAATVERPRSSFNSEVTMTLPPSDLDIVVKRTGQFDDLDFVGVGTRSFETEQPDLRELWGEDPFEFRFLDDVLWMLNPLGEPPSWSGFDWLEFGDFAGGNPLGSIDGDLYLWLIESATTAVLSASPQSDGSEIWTIELRADDLVPLVAAGGPAENLLELGAGESGLRVTGQLTVVSDRLVSALSVSLNDWWSRAQRLYAESLPTGSLSRELELEYFREDEHMQLEFRVESFDAPLAVTAPCEDATTRREGGLSVMFCND